MLTTVKAVVAATSVLLAGGGVDAIVTREEPQQAVTDLANAKFFVSLFARGDCAGSIIAASFVATAAHCVCGAEGSGVLAIDYLNQRRSAVAAYQNPGRSFNCNRDGPNSNDVAILEFAGAPFRDHDPRPVYAAGDEVGKTIWILGMGIKGRPDDFPSARACRNGPTDTSLREGFNTVDRATSGVLYYDMTPPGPSSHPREAIAQDGDSGGAALILADGEWMVAGANSGADEDNSCDWGSVDQYCRLSEHAAWIAAATDATVNDAARGLWHVWAPRPAPTEPPTEIPGPPIATSPNSPTRKPTTKPTTKTSKATTKATMAMTTMVMMTMMMVTLR